MEDLGWELGIKQEEFLGYKATKINCNTFFFSLLKHAWGIHGIYAGYSWGIHGVFMGYTYVSGMCRVCIGYVSGMYRKIRGGKNEEKMRFFSEKIW